MQGKGRIVRFVEKATIGEREKSGSVPVHNTSMSDAHETQ